MQLVNRGATAALAGAERFYLAESVAALPDGDPVKRFVCWCCLYAGEVLAGELPGPYTRRPPSASLATPSSPIKSSGRTSAPPTATRFGVPVEQVAARRVELGWRA